MLSDYCTGKDVDHHGSIHPELCAKHIKFFFQFLIHPDAESCNYHIALPVFYYEPNMTHEQDILLVGFGNPNRLPFRRKQADVFLSGRGKTRFSSRGQIRRSPDIGKSAMREKLSVLQNAIREKSCFLQFNDKYSQTIKID